MTLKLQLSMKFRRAVATSGSSAMARASTQKRGSTADCAAHVLASSVSAPLLFKGDDFSETDVKVCLLD
jgi:uncharacterized protein with PIN domain